MQSKAIDKPVKTAPATLLLCNSSSNLPKALKGDVFIRTCSILKDFRYAEINDEDKNDVLSYWLRSLL